jgi:hypothetical protein
VLLCAHVIRHVWKLRSRYYAQAEGVTIEITPERAELLRHPRGRARDPDPDLDSNQVHAPKQ